MSSPKEFLLKLHGNLQLLQSREAKYGGLAAPVSLIMQMEDYREAIQLTEQAIEHDVSVEELQTRFVDLNLEIRDTVEFKPARKPFDGRNPYRGLEKFTEQEHEFFFGRAAAITELVAMTQALIDKETTLKNSALLSVIGASGSGKSSLVRAGLIPALREGRITGSERWPIRVMLPGPKPIEALAQTFVKLTGRGLRSILDDLQRDEQGLHYLIKETLADEDENGYLTLVIDQFEELFTLCEHEQERRDFIKLLLYEAGQRHQRGLTILTMRADFYGRASQYPQLAQALTEHQMLVAPMTPQELREAILLPAEAVGLELEKELALALVQETVNEPGALPLLQHTLLELFNRRSEDDVLTMAAYQEIGGVRGALAHRADAVLNHLTPAQQELARYIFLRLTTLGEGVSDTRRRVSRTELYPAGADPETIDTVLQALSGQEARLIVADEETVEVTHEALLQQWGQLRAWLEGNRDSLRIRRRVTEAAEEWQANEQDDSYLFRGARLAEIEDWLDQHGGELTPEEWAFVSASIAERERAAQEEEERRQQELEQANKLREEAEARQKAEEERAEEAGRRAKLERQEAERQARQARLFRRLAIGLGIVLGVIVLLGASAELYFRVIEPWRLSRCLPDCSNANRRGIDWSGREDLKGANLRGTDLSEANLSKATLISATLADANLSKAALITATLTDADLSKATLTDADLSEANLSKATLTRADLSKATLTDADLSKATLISATLTGADLSGANLSGANFSDATLDNVTLISTTLTGTILSEVDFRGRKDLAGADLSGANLSGADFSGADLISTTLTGADLSKADLSRADFSGATLDRAILSEATLTGITLSGIDFRGRKDLAGADLSGANLSGADFSGADLISTTLTGADLSKADLSKANLSKANLSGAKLISTTLNKATLSNATLTGADLSEVDLSSATLKSSDLSGAELSRAILNNTNLTGAILNNAKLNEVHLRQAILNKASLINAKLNDADLGEANLSGAKLIAADLSYTKLISANMNSADLRDTTLISAILKGAILIGTDLNQANLDQADLSEAILIATDLSQASLISTTLTEAALTEVNLRGANLGFKDQIYRGFTFDYQGDGKNNDLFSYGRNLVVIVEEGTVISRTDKFAGYDFGSDSNNDHAFAFDYDSNGINDDLVFYRPGQGAIYIVKRDGNLNDDDCPEKFECRIKGYQGAPGAGLTDLLLIDGTKLTTSEWGRFLSSDRSLAFDYDRDGYNNDLVFYQPEKDVIVILKPEANQTFSKYDPNTISEITKNEFAVKASTQIFAIDYDKDGFNNDLVFYQPETKDIFVVKSNGDGTFEELYNSRG